MTTYIVDGVRTPIGALGGSLSPVRADDLAAMVIKELMKRNYMISRDHIKKLFDFVGFDFFTELEEHSVHTVIQSRQEILKEGEKIHYIPLDSIQLFLRCGSNPGQLYCHNS